MALSALDDLSREPVDDDVERVLRDAAVVWKSLIEWLGQEAGVDRLEWGSSGKKYGWGLRAKRGDRTIVYLIPQDRAFLVAIVLGDRAVAAARSATLPARVLEVIAAARRYAEGTGFRVPVHDLGDLAWVEELVRIKVAF
jgi:hypothetical protein